MRILNELKRDSPCSSSNNKQKEGATKEGELGIILRGKDERKKNLAKIRVGLSNMAKPAH